MNPEIRWCRRESDRQACSAGALCGVEGAERALAFHRSIPGYSPTPLVRLERLAKELGLAELYVKDESYRFGLNAFKVLGVSYCIGRYLCRRLGIPPEEMDYNRLTGPEAKKQLGPVTFVTATDGNHGRGIAWTAARMGQESVVYLPRGTARERLEHISALGARVEVTPWSYDETVRYARTQAAENGWILVQDTDWEGYRQIPAWIMEGYTTMGREIVEQLAGARPTHIFLQAGVGSMAGAVAGFFADYYREERPVITVVEPERADCIFRTAQAADGILHRAEGPLDTMMAGLACGEPCGLAWEVLQQCAGMYTAVPEWVAAKGMRMLGNPLPGDPRVISGESGAVTAGLVTEVMERQELAPLCEELGLNEQSRVLCISTEGATDWENYRRVVWDGRYPAV